MASKFKKKIKKFAKTAAKAAIIGGALYGGSKLLKGRGLKGNINAANMEDANIKAPLVDAADAGTKFKKIFKHPPYDAGADKNYYFKGGGIAKRGMGAAYKSGGRVKSMGIAKRGGGVAKR